LPDAAPDVESVVLVELPDVFEGVLDGLEGVELVVADGAALDVGAELEPAGELEGAGVVEVWVDVEPCPELASGSVYCWSPADGPLPSTVAGKSSAAPAATIRQTRSLRGMCGGEVLHSVR
jgi:hypothetical protein